MSSFSGDTWYTDPYTPQSLYTNEPFNPLTPDGHASGLSKNTEFPLDPYDDYAPPRTSQHNNRNESRHKPISRKALAAFAAGAVFLSGGSYAGYKHFSHDPTSASDATHPIADPYTAYGSLATNFNGGPETTFDTAASVEPQLAEALAGDTCRTKVTAERVNTIYGQLFSAPSPANSNNQTILEQLTTQTTQLEQMESAQQPVPLPEQFAEMQKQVNDYQSGQHWNMSLAEYESITAQYASQFGILFSRMTHEDTDNALGPIPKSLETELSNHKYYRETMVTLMADLSRISPAAIHAAGLKNISVGVTTVKSGDNDEAAFVNTSPNKGTIFIDVSPVNLREQIIDNSVVTTTAGNFINHELGHQKDAQNCINQSLPSTGESIGALYKIRNDSSGGTVLWRLIGADALSKPDDQSRSRDGGAIEGAAPLTGGTTTISPERAIDLPSPYSEKNRYELKAEVDALLGLTPELLFKGQGNATIVGEQVSIELAREEVNDSFFAKYEEARLKEARTLVAAENLLTDASSSNFDQSPVSATVAEKWQTAIKSDITKAQTVLYGPKLYDYTPSMDGDG